MSNEIEVNHPSHYNSGSIETIDFIMDQGFGKGFLLGNSLKYISRAQHKGTEKKDIEKAIWYLNKYLEVLNEETEDEQTKV